MNPARKAFVSSGFLKQAVLKEKTSESIPSEVFISSTFRCPIYLIPATFRPSAKIALTLSPWRVSQ